MTTTKVTSKDGTSLAVDRTGTGPFIVLVDGAFCRREFGPAKPLAKLLQDRFTVVTYDRRGRGESTDTSPYAVVREIEDLMAVVDSLKARPLIYGTSSGAVLVARAVAAGLPVTGCVLHEPPLSLDDTHVPNPPDVAAQIGACLREEKRSAAVDLFLGSVGVPKFGRMMMRVMPGVWSKMTPTAHTLPYDFAVLGDTQRGGPMPGELDAALGSIRVPTLVLIGGKSPPYMHHAAASVVKRIPNAELRELPGQQHTVSPKAVAPVLTSFAAVV